MTRQEIASLLEILVAQYPYVKVEDADSMVSAWEMCLGDFSAESVYKAARLHMDTCKFFPTISDIRDKIVRASIVYNESAIEINRLEAGSSEQTDIWDDERMERFCESIGFGYPNDIEDD